MNNNNSLDSNNNNKLCQPHQQWCLYKDHNLNNYQLQEIHNRTKKLKKCHGLKKKINKFINLLNNMDPKNGQVLPNISQEELENNVEKDGIIT